MQECTVENEPAQHQQRPRLASFIGSAIGILVMIRQRADSKLAITFDAFLALGALVALFWAIALSPGT